MAEYDDLRAQCLLGARILWRELRDVMGHVSCRLPNGEGFALKMVDFDCSRLQGEQPILEPYIHSEILPARPDVNAVVHAHPHMATVLSTTGKTVYAVTHQACARAPRLADGWRRSEPLASTGVGADHPETRLRCE